MVSPLRYMLSLFFLFFGLTTAIWPQPASFSYGETVLYISPDVQVNYVSPNQVSSSQGHAFFLSQWLNDRSPQTQPYGQNANQPAIVSTAISDALTTIFEHNFYPWRLRPRNTNFDPPSNASCGAIRDIQLTQTTADQANIYSAKAGDVDESYTLTISESGQVDIRAASSVGIAYGLNTFSQLFYRTQDSRTYLETAPVQIQDAPKFKHRGLNLDVARTYYSPQAILRQIDGLAYSKMNRLHVHITDSQSWPLEVPALPALADKGKYGQGFTYSPQTLQYIQEYGAKRGVQVYLEIDMPGHTGIIALAYPELVIAWNVFPDWSLYALEPPSGSLKLSSQAVYAFREQLFDDVLPRVNPYSAYWHFGGDEVLPEQYELDDGIQSNDTAIIKPFMQKFVSAAHDQIRANNLVPVVWEEMLLEWNLTLGSDVVVQCWKDSSAVLSTVEAGHQAIVGDSNNWYLDCGHGQWLDFYPGASSQQYYPYADYCSPRKNWRQIYAFDPLDNIPSNLTHLVIGGEVSMWGEQTDEIDVDSKVWPRAAAAAEVLWSGAKDANGQNRSQIEASPRLAEFRERLVAKGIMAEPIQMPFCTQNGTQCAL